MPDGSPRGRQPAQLDAPARPAPLGARPSVPDAQPLFEARARVQAAIAAACARHDEHRSLVAEASDLVHAAPRGGRDAAVPRVGLDADLRACVAAYVGGLRGDGLPAERVVVLVKGTVREATPETLDVGEARDLMEDVVRWTIEAYYAT
jgi:hypothetical protein